LDLCNKKVTGGPLIEALARYGDSSYLEKVPVSKLFDTNLTMSYAGTETWFKRRLYGRGEGYKTLQELEQKELSF
jgi:tRNA A37 threonylcarbamoyltransferase TsaD